MDSFAGHRTEEMASACKATGTLRMLIPGGLTGKLQPLDLTVNRSFKSKIKNYYNDAIVQQSYNYSRSTGGSKYTMDDGNNTIHVQSTKTRRLQLLCKAVRQA